ncbi:hypothetical protein NSQ20_08100 [Paenibacillus sp. FSL K6-1122]|uniref:Peptidase M10 metallopeptidase domain-containing protein n=1 Tax=Paenibacillus amylolyticus TaxID=1451 RepID=A0ABD8AX46_PAEAM|nr:MULTISPECIES: hypothetical protein [Paenibacillus]ETT38037.1 hypothetical protein C161_07933 [Paenibacillus sp. FSL R5-192]OME99303.1 hypothetical protein BK124_06760 [Paenibacillus amylolyticus]
MKKRWMVMLTCLMAAFLITASVKAASSDYYSGSWDTTSTTSLGIAVGSSMSSNLSSFQSWYTGWNGVSSKVGLAKPYEQSSLDQTPHFARINIIGKNLGSTGNWAETCNYKYSVIWGYSCDWNGSWKDSIIEFNTNTDSNTKIGYSFQSANLKKKIFLHELGHSLGLKHPDTTSNAIMKQGDNGYYVVQTYDKSNIKEKYGN